MDRYLDHVTGVLLIVFGALAAPGDLKEIIVGGGLALITAGVTVQRRTA